MLSPFDLTLKALDPVQSLLHFNHRQHDQIHPQCLHTHHHQDQHDHNHQNYSCYDF